jgi:hypothetical protein
MIRFGTIVLALTMVVLLSALAEATENSTGPVRVNDGDNVVCVAANAGSGNVNNVAVTIKFNRADGSSNGEEGTGCATLAPSLACIRDSGGFANDYAAFCEITFPSGKIRGTLCNLTKHLCSDSR